MPFDLFIAAGEIVAPLVGAHAERTIIERLDTEILDEIHAFVRGVRIGPIAFGGRKPAFVSQRDHMRRIQRFYVGTCLRSPVIDNGDVVAAAAGLVAEFPGENGVGVFVAGEDEFDVVAVGLLGRGVCVEGYGSAA